MIINHSERTKLLTHLPLEDHFERTLRLVFTFYQVSLFVALKDHLRHLNAKSTSCSQPSAPGK